MTAGAAERDELRASVRRVLAERADPVERWAALSGIGVAGLLVPEVHGGSGAGLAMAGVVAEELGRALDDSPFLASAIGAVSAIVLAGDEAPQGRWLPRLADGSLLGGIALAEPGRRLATAPPSTRATVDDGSWRLSGTKAWALGAIGCGVLIVSATTDDGVALFAVESGTPGVLVEPAGWVDESRPAATVRLDGAAAQRLGGDDTTVTAIVDRLLAVLVADGVGAAVRALELAVEYAKTRHQFGVPIGSFQSIQHLCADMLRDVELGRAAAWAALEAADADDPEERHRTATMAKAFAGEAFDRVGASAIQVFGGIGFTLEHDAHRYFRRLLAVEHLYGTSGDHLDELADLVV